jgi:predicted TIM-barrel fold metal-dependent hydrolase
VDRHKLELHTEAVEEPDLEIIDAHHHLWAVASSSYGLYDLADLRLDTGSGHNVTQTVFIDCGSSYRAEGPEAMQPVGETEFVAGRADESDRTPGAKIAAIVSHADLSLGPDVEEVLEAHVAAAGGRFRGVRHSEASDHEVPAFRTAPPPGLYRHPDFQEGASVLASMGLSFEAWQYHHQLGDVAALAEHVPELTIIVNHLGGPLAVGTWADRQDEVQRDLREALTGLSRHSNVHLKLGGIGMPRLGAVTMPDGRSPSSQALAEHWGDLLRFGIDTFGPDRCLFESNYPVDGETASYRVLWNAFKLVSAGYSESERADLFAGTARRVYRLA